MRRTALLVVLLALGGCSGTAWQPVFVGGNNPNAPAGDSENMRRAMGEDVAIQPLTPQPGDVWPGPVPPTPTLQDLERQSNLQPQPEQAVPGSPIQRGAQPNEQPSSPPPSRARGSSTPPGSNQPGLPPPANVPPPQAPSAAAAPPAPSKAGRAVATPSGPGVTTGGGSGYQTMTTPDGGSAIVVPNGNGTSTVIRSDGTIETIPTPR